MRLVSFLPYLLLFNFAVAQDPCAVEFSNTPITCPGDDDATLTVVGAPGLYTYSWSHDGSLAGATATGLGPGTYTVSVSDTSGCVSFLEYEVTLPEIPPLGTMTAVNISCAGNNDGSLTFTLNPGGPYDWEWMHDPTETSTTLTELGPGTYVVLVTDPPNCPSYIFGSLGDPDITIIGSPEYCPSDPPLLSCGPEWGFEPDIFSWSTGEITSSIQILPGMNGTIEVTAIDTSSGCVADAEILITEMPSPFVEFSPPDSVCMDLWFEVSVTATDADSLVWQWGSSGISNSPVSIISFQEPYWQPISLQGFDLFGCGSAPVLDSIYIHPLEPATFTVEQIPCSPMVKVDLQSLADSCAFFIGDSLMISDCSGVYRLDLKRYQDHDFTFIATQPSHCNDTTHATLEVRTEPTLFLPNAFTPNGDGINDLWPGPVDVPDLGYEIQVFDRRGMIHWSTKDPTEVWDGSTLPSGMYIYTMRMRDPCEPTNEVARRGYLMLMR